MYPPSLIIVGLSLLFFYKAGTEVTILLAIKVVIVNLIVWAGIIFFVKRTYLNTINTSIQKGIFHSADIYIADQQTIDILLKRIEVIYALDLLETSRYPGLHKLLEQQLIGSTDIEVKKYVLERMDFLGNIDLHVLNSLLQTDPDIDIQVKVISLICKTDNIFLKKYAENITVLEPAIKKTIIINLLNQREFDHLFTASNEIHKLLNSPDTVQRELAIEIISELKNIGFTEALKNLLNDNEVSVKRLAVLTICKLRIKALLPAITELLDKPADKNIVLKGFQSYGDSLFEDIRFDGDTTLTRYAGDFINIAGKVKGKSATSFLVLQLENAGPALKDKLLHSLWIKEYIPESPGEHEKFHSLLDGYIISAMDKVKDYNQIPDFNDKELVKRSIFNEIKKDLALAVKACSIVFRKKELNRILQLMELEKKEQLYNAMEMLELVLPKKFSKDLNFLFDFILDPQYANRVIEKNQMATFYNKVIFSAPLLYNPWTKAVCVYCSWKSNETGFLRRLKDHTDQNEHYLVKETRNYVCSL